MWKLISVKQEARWPYQVKYTETNLISVIYMEPHISQARDSVTISGKIYTRQTSSVWYIWNLISVKLGAQWPYQVKYTQCDICDTVWYMWNLISVKLTSSVWYMWNLISIKQKAQWPYQVKYTETNLISVIFVEPHISQARSSVTISGKIYTMWYMWNLISVRQEAEWPHQVKYTQETSLVWYMWNLLSVKQEA